VYVITKEVSIRLKSRTDFENMKICVIGSSKRFFSGITNQTIFLANALSKRNEVTVILLRNLLPSILFPGRRHIGKNQYVTDFAPGVAIYDGMDYNSPLSWWRAYRFLRKHKPDAIVMLWWTSAVAHMQVLLRSMNSCTIHAKTVLEMHEVVDPLEERIFPLRIYSRLTGHWLVRKVDACTTKSEFNKKRVARIYGITENKINVVPHGLYEDYIKTPDKKESKESLGISEEFIILHFGLIRHYKGVQYLIKAFNALPRDVAECSRLLVVGEIWEERVELQQMVDCSPYKDRVSLISEYVADDMIPKYFSVSDIVVLPYLRTAGSGVAHLAMTYGKSIILSELETLRETVGNYPGAVFTPVEDSAAIRDKLLEAFYNKKSKGDIQYTAIHPSWDDIACQYEAIIKRLISETGIVE
jgi:glycosyltransferase involved in cell wall biosynthesis